MKRLILAVGLTGMALTVGAVGTADAGHGRREYYAAPVYSHGYVARPYTGSPYGPAFGPPYARTLIPAHTTRHPGSGYAGSFGSGYFPGSPDGGHHGYPSPGGHRRR